MSNVELVRYNAARKALAEVHKVDEVKDIRDKAVAMQVYAKQAKDTELIRYSTDIKFRAERRAGEMLSELPKAKGSRGQIRGPKKGSGRGAGKGKGTSVGGTKIKPPTDNAPTLEELGITKSQSSKWQKQAKLDDKIFEQQLEKRVEKVVATVNGEKKTRGTQGTGENEWYTPVEYLELARKVLGDFDLDPASHEKAQETVKAKRFFSEQDDGLKQNWDGAVWLNPPYAQPHISNFANKLVLEVKDGRVTEAIMLTHNYTDTEWFHKAANACQAICFTRGRIKFWNTNGEIAAPTQGQAFFYFGHDVDLFASTFSAIGFVVVPCRN